MLRVAYVSLFGFLTLCAPALAQGNCIEPYAPVIPAAETVSEPQILSVQTQVQGFLADSDSYQRCLEVYIRQMREEAEREREPADTTTITRIIRMIESNQREKVRVGEEYNAVARAYNALHNPPPAPAADAEAATDPSLPPGTGSN
jgi:hypothetical protein